MRKELIHTVFESVVAQFPDNIAIESSDQRITYADLNRRANRLAHVLEMLGVQKGEIINVVAVPGINVVTTILGTFKAGGIYLPMDIRFSATRFLEIFNKTFDGILVAGQEQEMDAKHIVSTYHIQLKYLVILKDDGELTLSRLENGKYTAVIVPESETIENNPTDKCLPDDGNYIFYTSGSTGEGKAILGKHISLSHFIHWEIKEFGLDQFCVVSQLAQLTFDASLRDIFVPLCTGGTLCVPAADVKNDLLQLAHWLDRSRITLVHSVPSIFRMLTRMIQNTDTKPEYPDLKYVLLAGEGLYAQDVLNWRNATASKAEIVNLYGATETTLVKTFNRIKELPNSPSQLLSVGKPIPGAFIAIINRGKLCKTGEIGEIFIKSPFITKGYYRNEELTNAVFIQNPFVTDQKDIVYKTGDLGRMSANGDIEILGREDNQVKVNGVRVELNEIEDILRSHSGVEQTVVMVHKGILNNTELTGYYIGNASEDELHQYLAGRINGNVVPSLLIKMKEFPITINGKIDKQKLPKPDSFVASIEYHAPKTSTERQLEAIWKEVLAMKRVSRDLCFFKIGGHSLSAIQLVSRINSTMTMNLRLADVFKNDTIKLQANLIDSLTRDSFYEIKPALSGTDTFETTVEQYGLWFLCQGEGGNGSFNICIASEIDGKLNYSALQDSFYSVINRHEILHTTFRDQEGRLMHHVVPFNSADYKITFSDLDTGQDVEEKVKDILRKEETQRFDLENGPLIKFHVVVTDVDKHIVILTAHHIISDGWSMDILLRDLVVFYNANVKSEPAVLPALSTQFKDYATWLNKNMESYQLNNSRKYWLNNFGEGIPKVTLPVDYPRPVKRTYNGEATYVHFSDGDLNKLKAISDQCEVSLFVVLTSLLNILLYRYSGQTKMVVGAPFAGRDLTDLNDQVGFYTLLLPLKFDISQLNTFGELMSHVESVVMNANANQLYPMSLLREDLKIPRDGQASLFDILVKFSAQAAKVPAIVDAVAKPTVLSESVSQFEITFDFILNEEQLDLKIEYNTDLFSEGTILGLKDHFMRIVKRIHTDTSVSFQSIEMMDEIELLTAEGWSATLETPKSKLCLADNFFLLGGNNSKAELLAEFLYRRFGASLSIGDLHSRPTLLEMSRFIKAVISIAKENEDIEINIVER